ncbi:MAG TPA: hypothetical protein VFQ00_01310 [Terriglobales bacterium]|nr:hypothetical protein [Terriglobales bacterium]
MKRHFILTGVALLVLVLWLPLSLAVHAEGNEGNGSFDKPEIGHKPLLGRSPAPSFKISAGIDGDVFPAFANYASMQTPDQREWGVVSVQVANPSDHALRYRVAVRVPGWSDEEVQIVNVAPGSTKASIFAPTFLPRLYSNREIRAATAQVKITTVAGAPVYSRTVPVRLRAAEDMFWGAHFKYAQFIASWVTPHDLRIERVLSEAKEYMPGRRLPGYEDWKDAAGQERDTRLQARSIYLALQHDKLSYVKSSLTFGSNQNVSERIRTPRESIATSSANCIDGSVLFASAFENLGMDPQIVLIPGHAYVAVRVAEQSDEYLYIDTALTGRVSFEAAVAIADRGLSRYQPSQITRIKIADARRAGIYPMPE